MDMDFIIVLIQKMVAKAKKQSIEEMQYETIRLLMLRDYDDPIWDEVEELLKYHSVDEN